MIKKHKSKLLFFLLFVLLVSSLISLKVWRGKLKSPIGENFQFRYISDWLWPKKNNNQTIVYGFLPYWNLNKVKLQAELSHLSYFALEVGADGQMITQSRPGETEPGYRQLNSDRFFDLINEEVLASNLNLELVLSQFDSTKIEQLLSDQQAWLNLLEQIDSLLLAYPFTGINLDFEYQGEASEQVRQQFTNLVISIHQHLAQHQNQINLSIDVYASAGNKNKKLLWNISQLEPYLNYVIVMAYDFHGQSSAQAGPGAPLFGSQELWNNDINRFMKGFFEQIPREKILLGIPFYGYGWQTDSLEAQANTYPSTGFTVSYQEVLNLKNLSGRWEQCSNLKIFWQEEALSPFATVTCPKNHQENDVENELSNYLVYYEDAQSLRYKINYAKQLEIAGIAIWALGYEGESRDLWEVIKGLNN